MIFYCRTEKWFKLREETNPSIDSKIIEGRSYDFFSSNM